MLLASGQAEVSGALGWGQGVAWGTLPPIGMAKEASLPGGLLLWTLTLCCVLPPWGIQGPPGVTTQQCTALSSLHSPPPCFHILGHFLLCPWVSFCGSHHHPVETIKQLLTLSALHLLIQLSIIQLSKEDSMENFWVLPSAGTSLDDSEHQGLFVQDSSDCR